MTTSSTTRWALLPPGLVSRVAAVTALVLVVAGCGSRVDRQEVSEASGRSTVALDAATIAALRSPVAQSPPADSREATESARRGRTVGSVGQLPSPSLELRPRAPERRSPDGATKKRSAPNATGTAPAAEPAELVAARTSAPCTGAGAPLRIGQVGAFSGILGSITINGRTALAAWAQAMNAQGGLACHPVVLYQVDDGADPARAAAIVQNLVDNKGVQALVGAFDPLGFNGIVSGVEKMKVPVVGGDGLNDAWANNRYLFPPGATNVGNIRVLLRQMVQADKRKIGLIYCVEATVCTDVAKTITAETPKVGADLVYNSPVSTTQTDYTAQCINARNAGVQAFGVSLDGPSLGRVARSCSAIGYRPLFIGNAITLTEQVAEDPTLRRSGFASTGAIAPWLPGGGPGQREYQAAMAKYAPNTSLGSSSITMWATGKLLEAVVAGLGDQARLKPIETADVFAGLATIRRETLGGLIPPITFTAGQKSAPPIRCSYYVLLTEQGWTAPNGNRPICA